MSHIKSGLMLLLLMSLLTGLIYPLLVTFLAQVFFPSQANGSLIEENGKIIGSRLIGQSFDSPEVFWGRPSATTPHPYNGAKSSGSNMGPSNPVFLKSVQDRVDHLRQSDPTHNPSIPVDLVTASGSGLDPEISPRAALYQVPRIAKSTNIPESEIKSLIEDNTKSRTFGILGEARVNVLELNLALNKLRSAHGRSTSQSN